MRRFECLSKSCPILGTYLLEASAGTGKTFAIEHVIVRLILEGLTVESILAVTFTKAAARELKQRIRSNLESARSMLQSKLIDWEYLEVFAEDPLSQDRIEEALLHFESAQIFTIHGFCYRMLQEFAFEANLSLFTEESDHFLAVSPQLKRRAKRFLEEELKEEHLSSEQIEILIKGYDDLNSLIDQILQEGKVSSGPTFSESFLAFQQAVRTHGLQKIEKVPLLEDFQNLSSDRRKKQHQLERQICCLVESMDCPEKSAPFRTLIKGMGSVFTFLEKQLPSKQQTLQHPEFFTWVLSEVAPLIRQAAKKSQIFQTLVFLWQTYARPFVLEEGALHPDEILTQMQIAVQNCAFRQRVQDKYQAVIIDEFQDTDPVQWEIFSHLFLNLSHLKAFYLVGDPRQSIYRFRRADIYTYLQAKQALGDTALYCLDTNYRSSKRLIEALNALFARRWLTLPKTQEALGSPIVQAGRQEEIEWTDGKGALHFLFAEDTKESFAELFLPYAIAEIERLLPLCPSLSSYALIVKDRYQAQAALERLALRGLPATAKNHTSLGQTFAAQSLFELLDCFAHPHDLSRSRIVEKGPFQKISLKKAKEHLLEKGLASFFRAYLPYPLEPEFQQLIEAMLFWETKYGSSLPQLLLFFEDLKNPSSPPLLPEGKVDAIQVLTMHMSKGLEFEIVFAFGPATRTPETEDVEEGDAEKLRQLYVTMTRAKERLYLPVPCFNRIAPEGTKAPIEIFQKILEREEGVFLRYIETLAQTKSITYETLHSQLNLSAPLFVTEKKEIPAIAAKTPPPLTATSFIQSFTSLQAFRPTTPTQEKIPDGEGKTAHTLPKGKEVGVIIHSVFEAIFRSASAWKSPKSTYVLIENVLKTTPLMEWAEVIAEMVQQALDHPLILDGTSFCLRSLAKEDLSAELELVFLQGTNFMKGFIDLVFVFQGKYYIVDWKTNWLGPKEESYLRLEQAMDEHDYWLQAEIYAEGLYRHVKQFYMKPFHELLGGAIYYFLRGNQVCYVPLQRMQIC